jgi:hypothetical protein
MIVWELDLQLPMQSVPITTKVVSSNSAHGEAYTIQHLGVVSVGHWLKKNNQLIGIIRYLSFIQFSIIIGMYCLLTKFTKYMILDIIYI